MIEKTVLQQLLDAHQLLRHDFMNNLQVINGYQQIGQPEKANEYIFKTVDFLRSFSQLGKLEAPLLQGLLITYLTKYSQDSALVVRVPNPPALNTQEETAAAELLHGIVTGLSSFLQSGEITCQIVLGAETNILFRLVLEGAAEALTIAQEKVAPFLNNSFYYGEMQQKGNTIQVDIRF